MASLAEGASTISNALFSRDTKATMAACRAMGAELKESGSTIRMEGTHPRTPGGRGERRELRDDPQVHDLGVRRGT